MLPVASVPAEEMDPMKISVHVEADVRSITELVVLVVS